MKLASTSSVVSSSWNSGNEYPHNANIALPPSLFTFGFVGWDNKIEQIVEWREVEWSNSEAVPVSEKYNITTAKHKEAWNKLKRVENINNSVSFCLLPELANLLTWQQNNSAISGIEGPNKEAEEHKAEQTSRDNNKETPKPEITDKNRVQ